MKVLRIIIPLVALVYFTNIQQGFSQDITRAQKREIRNQEEDIRVNEEMLLSGIKGLERIKSRLEKVKSKGRISKEELGRKEKIVRSVEARLARLDGKINTQKEALQTYKESIQVNVEKEVAPVVVEKATKTASSNNDDLAARAQRIKEAREKLEREMEESKAAFLKQQEELRKENQKLAQLDNQLKAEKKAIEDKVSAAKRRKIMEYEDDISVNEEMLISGKEGLNRKKNQLEKAKEEGALTTEDVTRKMSIIKRIEKRLNTLQSEINTKKEAMNALKAS